MHLANFLDAASHPAHKWDDPDTRKSILNHWSTFTLKHSMDGLHDTIEYCEDGTISMVVSGFMILISIL